MSAGHWLALQRQIAPPGPLLCKHHTDPLVAPRLGNESAGEKEEGSDGWASNSAGVPCDMRCRRLRQAARVPRGRGHHRRHRPQHQVRAARRGVVGPAQRLGSYLERRADAFAHRRSQRRHRCRHQQLGVSSQRRSHLHCQPDRWVQRRRHPHRTHRFQGEPRGLAHRSKAAVRAGRSRPLRAPRRPARYRRSFCPGRPHEGHGQHQSEAARLQPGFRDQEERGPRTTVQPDPHRQGKDLHREPQGYRVENRHALAENQPGAPRRKGA